MIRPVRPDGSIETGGTFVPIPRRRVAERIASAAMQRVVLFIAPAGYGKSVALRQHLATVTDPYVCFDVLPEHASLLGFLRGFAEAMRDVAPDALSTLPGAYDHNANAQAPGTDLALWMHSHIKAFRGIVAIDDLHIAQEDREVPRFLTALIERTKGRVQWLLASRSTAGLPIGTWLAYGDSDLAIDDHDLRFTVEEAREAARIFRLGVRDEELSELLQLTDGWPTAMSFALRSSTRSVDLRTISTMTREMTYRYLAEQVYFALSEDEREFIEAAALLPEIDVGIMVEAGYDRAAALLEELQQRVAFLHERDDAQGVYRIHDLFREFVLHQLMLRGEETARAVRRRLAAVLADRNRVAAAVRLYAEADARDEVVPLIERWGFDLIAKGHGDIVAQAIESLKHSQNATILGLRGVTAIGAGHYDDGDRLLMLALKHTEEPELRSALALRAALLRVNRGRDASDLLRAVVADDCVSESARLEAKALLAVYLASAGKREEAAGLIDGVADVAESVETEEVLARLLHRIGVTLNFLGRAEEAKRWLERAVDVAVRTALWSIVARSHALLALIAALQDNDTKVSLWYAQQATSAAGKAGDYFDLQLSLLQMLSLETRRGSADRAVQVERQLADLRANDASRTMYIAASRAHRHAWNGRFDEAHRLFGSVIHRQAHPPDRAETQAVYALCLALDGRRKESGEAVEAAITDIQAGKNESGQFGMASYEIALLFCALSEALNGRHAAASKLMKRRPLSTHAAMQALRSCTESLTLAAKTPTYTVADMSEALSTLSALGFGGYAHYLPWIERTIVQQSAPETEEVVRLTPSELKIVRDLAAGLTPKDIAADMGRSVYTVQTHIQNLIDKLGCHGRAEAIAAVRRLGLLSSQ